MKKRLVNPMLEHYRVLYKRGNYAKRQSILAELQEEFGYHRKAAIRLLNGYNHVNITPSVTAILSQRINPTGNS